MDGSIEGGCLCGMLRYRATTSPLWVTVCYCRFCQKATGSDRMIEPIFERKEPSLSKVIPRSSRLHPRAVARISMSIFARRVGTKLALTFGRWPDHLGLYAGTLDDPGAVSISKELRSRSLFPRHDPTPCCSQTFPPTSRHAADNNGRPIASHAPAAPVRQDLFRSLVQGGSSD